MARNSTKPKDDTTPAVEEEQGNINPIDEGTPSADVGGTSPVEGAKVATGAEDDQGNANPATEEQEDNAAPATDEESFVGTHMVNTARGLNLREAPSYGAPVLEILPCGTAVYAIDPEGAPAGWLCVMTEDGKSGYVAERYVSPIEE